MKKQTRFLVGGLFLAASLLLLLNNRGETENNEESKEKEESKRPKDKGHNDDVDKNKDLINNTLKDLVSKGEFDSLPDLLTNLVSEVVKRSKDIDILYDTPKNVEELEESLVLMNLYDEALEKISGNNA